MIPFAHFFAPKSKNLIFGSFSVLTLITCQLFEMPHFLMFEIFEMPHFSYLILKMGKMGHFKYFEHRKMGQMESHDKIILHMLYGAFHITPRMRPISIFL